LSRSAAARTSAAEALAELAEAAALESTGMGGNR
jgi:hypothetical protein